MERDLVMTSWAGCPNNFQGQSLPLQSIFSSLWSCCTSSEASETGPKDQVSFTIIEAPAWMHTDWYSCHVNSAKRSEGRMFSIIWCWQAHSSPFTLNCAQPQAGLKNRHVVANFNFLTNRRAAFALTALRNPVRVTTLSLSYRKNCLESWQSFSHEFVRAGSHKGP